MRCIDCSKHKMVYDTCYCTAEKRHRRIAKGDELKDIVCFRLGNVIEQIKQGVPLR